MIRMNKNNAWALERLKQADKLIKNNKQLIKEYPNEKGLHIDQMSLEMSRKDILDNHFTVSLEIPISIKEDEGFFVAKASHNVASQGKTVKEAIENVTEALELYLGD